ncbi:hypothetical protein [Aeromonas caviae]|uniref:hypothetical protein n=1 Tax=Aeromonas caviae TaxID=648 RepID=UPI000FEBFCD2|nr:hypothetical protein [Aeromonas caviae]
MTWKNSVNMAHVALAIQDPALFVEEITISTSTPIDNFYSTTSEINTKCTPLFISENGNVISSLMLIGLISATENYFREVLGQILSLCPVSQLKSVEQKIQLGSLLWGDKSAHNKTAFEFLAFSNSKNVIDTFNNFLGHQVSQHGSWKIGLREYDKLCELRHAIVHSDNIIAGKNAIKLVLQKNKKPLRIKIDYANLQNASLVCTSVVQAANNELFEMMIGRWAQDWRQLGCPPELISDASLLKIRRLFLSKRDKNNKTIINKLVNNKFIEQVKTDFNL